MTVSSRGASRSRRTPLLLGIGGLVLVVTAGVGWVQHWGGPVQEVRPGDVVWIPPGTKHWHGAIHDQPMAHVAIGERLDGRSVDWLEKVSDAKYAQALRSDGRP